MGTFLNALDRNKLVDALTELGMPQDMAEEFASWPDDADQMDINMTATVNQVADYKEKLDAGDKSVTKRMVAGVVMLISYMQRIEERGWNQLQLPRMNEAMNSHNQRWAVGSTLQ